MRNRHTTRRAFLGSSVLAGAALPFSGLAVARPEPTSDYVYEVTRTEAEWRRRLSEFEYQVLRDGGTEWARTSALWEDYREGEFYCKGCDLHLYSSDWRVPLDKGWVFFAHSQPDAVLTDIDKSANYAMDGGNDRTLIEVHCRRCGSHMGHLLTVETELVHCINGVSLNFEPAAA